MFMGLNTRGHVARLIMEDFHTLPMRAGTRYPNPLAMIYDLFEGEQSIASQSEGIPYYLRWTMRLDEDGDPYPEIAPHRMAMVSYRRRNDKKDRWRCVFPYEFGCSNWEILSLEGDINNGTDMMIRHGLSFGQDYISRGIAAWSSPYGYGYEEDVDLDWKTETVYASRIRHPRIMIDTGHVFSDFKGLSI